MFFKFLIALHLLLLSVSTTVKANTKFLFCIENYDAKPYYYTSETSEEHDNNLKGVLVEVATKAAEKVGWSAEIVRHPWLRCQHLVKQGKIHGLLTMIKNEDRLQQFAFPPNELYLAEVKLAIIAKRGGLLDRHSATSKPLFDENNLLDLAAYKAIQESGLDAPFAHISYRYLKQQNVLTPIHTTVDIGLRLVTQGRLDGYVVEQKVAAELVANSEYSEQLTITSGLLMHTYVFSPVNLAFFDKNKKQVTAFWQALHEAALQINK